MNWFKEKEKQNLTYNGLKDRFEVKGNNAILTLNHVNSFQENLVGILNEFDKNGWICIQVVSNELSGMDRCIIFRKDNHDPKRC